MPKTKPKAKAKPTTGKVQITLDAAIYDVFAADAKAQHIGLSTHARRIIAAYYNM